MRLLAAALVLVMPAALVARPAGAEPGVKVHVAEKTYPVSGGTGAALVDAMDRSGPKHGFMTRAIAQTSYTVDWDLKVKRTGDACKLVAADGTLDLTYVFPRVTSPMTPALERRWRSFFSGVERHERTHGRIARAMMAASRKAALGVAEASDPSCRKTRAEAKRRIKQVYDRYEARQVAFDAREHGPGGKVERLVRAFIR